MKPAVVKGLLNSYSYQDYRKIVSELLAQGKSTGNTQSESLLHYSLLNQTRMNRLEKTTVIDGEISQKLKSLEKDYTWLVISEGWCGDAAQLLPVFHKMAALSQKIELRIAFRDDNEELMEMFLTSGTRSIPKLIVIEEDSARVIGDFGPRPKEAAEMVRNYKAEFGVIDEKIKTELQLWYLHDKGFSAQREVMALMG